MDNVVNKIMGLSFNKPAVTSSTVVKDKKSPMLLSKSNFTEFNHREHVKITPNSARMTYFRRQSGLNYSKWGQLKLMVAQIQFINKYWNPEKHPDPITLYVGAAPGSWWPLFAEMYPSFEVHLVDPMPFDEVLVKWNNDNPDKAKIFLYNKLFDDDDVVKWKEIAKTRHVFFVSDIRNTAYGKDDVVESAKLVDVDMQLQLNWVKEINPDYAQFKFRLPFEYEKDNPYYEYIAGTVYYQMWVGLTSSETRLVTKKPHPLTQYNIPNYEEACMAHNTTIRNPGTTQFFNPFDNSMTPIAPNLGLFNDWDSVAMIYNLREYLEKVTPDGTASKKQVIELFNKIDNILGSAHEAKRKSAGKSFIRVRLKTKRDNLV